MKRITQLKNACLNISEIIENTYESIVYCDNSEEEVRINELEERLSKFCTLVKDFSVISKLSSNVEYLELVSKPKVYLDTK